MTSKNKMATSVGGTLIFSSTGAYGENFFIGCNSAKKAGMVIDYTIE